MDIYLPPKNDLAQKQIRKNNPYRTSQRPPEVTPPLTFSTLKSDGIYHPGMGEGFAYVSGGK